MITPEPDLQGMQDFIFDKMAQGASVAATETNEFVKRMIGKARENQMPISVLMAYVAGHIETIYTHDYVEQDPEVRELLDDIREMAVSATAELIKLSAEARERNQDEPDDTEEGRN